MVWRLGFGIHPRPHSPEPDIPTPSKPHTILGLQGIPESWNWDLGRLVIGSLTLLPEGQEDDSAPTLKLLLIGPLGSCCPHLNTLPPET